MHASFFAPLSRASLWRMALLLLVPCSLVFGCAHAMLPGTQVPDTPASRQVFETLVDIRKAMEARDGEKLLSHISEHYFEDNGTPDPKDDYGYLELRESLLSDALGTAKDLSLSMQLYDITVQGDHAWADLRYTSRARLEFPSGRLWDSHRDFDRVEFVREDGVWRIVRGL